MRRRKKYKKRQKANAVKGANPQQLTEEIKALIDELTTSYDNMLLAIRGDLIRARGRIRERQRDDVT